MTCNEICHRYKISKPKELGRYASGQKRCNPCDIFMEWDGFFCPCCNKKLRLSPRNGKYKEKFLQTKSRKTEVMVHGM